MAAKEKGNKGAKLIELLERRLDNVVYRLGWAVTRRMARQMVSHRHITVNGKVVNIPSYIVEVGDEIGYRIDKMQKAITNMQMPKSETPKWLKKSKNNGKVESIPKRGDIDIPIKESLIVELYSK